MSAKFRIKRPHRRGAAGQQYAIVVGLIAVVAIAAITSVGGGVSKLLSRTGNALTFAVNSSSTGSTGGTGGSGTPDCGIARVSCLAHLQAGCTASGAYSIDPDGAGAIAPANLACDQTTDGGGWTLFAKNGNTTRATFTGASTTGYNVSNLANTTANDASLPFASINLLFQNGNASMRYHYNGSAIAYYKRMTAPAGYDFASAFYTWSSANAGTVNTDFRIHSTVTDMNVDTLRWSTCNYDVTVAFPRDCGPSGTINNRWFTGTSAPGGWTLQAWVR